MLGQSVVQERRDQASRLREVAGKANRSALTIAVTSGKGGVGKTSVAVNLSICLAAKGVRVTLVDLDMGLANADLLMGLRTRYTLSHVVSGQRSIEEISTVGPGGLRFIPGGSGLDQFANMSDFERRNLLGWLKTLEKSADIVVLDCGAGISRNVVGFAAHADRVIVISTPEPTAVTDAYAMIKVLRCHQGRGRICIFVNMAASRAQARGTYERLASVSKRFLDYSVADAGYMLHDESVERAVSRRCPFVIGSPGSNASACIAAMAENFAKAVCGPRSRGSFFRRVVGLFA